MPEPKAQRNFTDPDSRIMPDGAHKGSFVQAYNAQIAVDSEAQIIVAANITQQQRQTTTGTDVGTGEQNTGASPVACSADTGYWSPEQVTDKRVEGIDLHVATGRDKHGASAAPIQVSDEGDLLQQMRQKLQSEAGRAVYKMRKAIVEPVFGQIKNAGTSAGFSLRGLENVQAEWTLVCLTHNLLKLYRAGRGDADVGSMNQGPGFLESSFYRQHTGCLRSIWIVCDSFRRLFIQYAALHPSINLIADRLLDEAIQQILASKIDIALFMSAIQVDHLFQVAGPEVADSLRAAFQDVVVASIGPICSIAIRRHGLQVDLEPDHPKMGSLISAVAERAPALVRAKRS